MINIITKQVDFDEELKKNKQKGRNRDFHISQMDNYQQMQKQLNQDKEKLENADKKSLELDTISNEIKEQINNLKVSKLNKDNLIITREEKNKIINYIDKVDKTNKEFKSVQKLSITLNNVNDELKENKKTINKLEKENVKLKDKIDDLKDELEESKDEISSLKSTINSLKNI